MTSRPLIQCPSVDAISKRPSLVWVVALPVVCVGFINFFAASSKTYKTPLSFFVAQKLTCTPPLLHPPPPPPPQQLQRDLQSPNHLQVCVALIALTNIGTKDMIPALLPCVIPSLTHKQALVRKKAVMAMHHFWRMDKESVVDYSDQFRRILCDTDPSVMASGLHILMALAKDDPNAYKDLVPSFVSILKQITEHRLSRDYDYHRMPAPWIQIKLLQKTVRQRQRC